MQYTLRCTLVFDICKNYKVIQVQILCICFDLIDYLTHIY